MSHPVPGHEYGDNEFLSDSPHRGGDTAHYAKGSKTKALKKAKKVNYTGTHEHSHHKGGLAGALKGLIETKNFGIKKGARKTKKNEMPF